ncbi:MAG: hypothetical protein AUJ21_03445 [Anaerolineae bacterium CG1_02_58_13]|nr:MAG: hypothetical protein AUJ21_03445 [Anaerolineae bacterium CG1_02_58_13]
MKTSAGEPYQRGRAATGPGGFEAEFVKSAAAKVQSTPWLIGQRRPDQVKGWKGGRREAVSLWRFVQNEFIITKLTNYFTLGEER